MIQMPLQFTFCNTVKSVKQNTFLETLYFHWEMLDFEAVGRGVGSMAQGPIVADLRYL
jgi:hypothetical protein